MKNVTMISRRNFIHNGIVVLQQPPPLFHVVRFQNLLTGFLNGQFRAPPSWIPTTRCWIPF